MRLYTKAVVRLTALPTGYTEDAMIPFNKPPVVGTEVEYMQQAMKSGKLCGDSSFTKNAKSGWKNGSAA